MKNGLPSPPALARHLTLAWTSCHSTPHQQCYMPSFMTPGSCLWNVHVQVGAWSLVFLPVLLSDGATRKMTNKTPWWLGIMVRRTARLSCLCLIMFAYAYSRNVV